MRKMTVLAGFVLTVSLGGAASACSSGTADNAASSTGAANAVTTSTNSQTNVVSGAHSAATSADETPVNVKNAFPDAQSFTMQHKDIPSDGVAAIEKETGGKVPDKDHHSYLAFSTTGGARKQVGAATVIKANGTDLIVIYENKAGSPYIREVRGEGVPAPFLAQFAGKGHDDKFQIGADLKAAAGVNEATAKSFAQAIRIDAVTMQTLYGAAHAH